jgi:peptide deformylase
VNAKIGVFDDGSLLALAKEMIDLMYLDDGVGLAAPQVGVNIRMMVFNPRGKEGKGQETILVNPEIVSVSATKAVEEEGCLSFPKIFAPVERPRDIVVRAQNEKGEPVQFNLGGDREEGQWISRIFQHEYDHLQGILYHDRMKAPALDVIREPLLALEEEFISANPGVAVKRIPAPKKKGF